MAFADLRTPIDGVVYSTDASKSGGCVCESTGLTKLGWQRIRQLQAEGRLHEQGTADVFFEKSADMSAKVRWSYQLPTYVVLIGLFDGMGCLRVSAARMGLTVLGYISCEIDKAAKRVVRLRWPGVIEWNNIESVYRDVVDSTMKSFAGLASVVWLGAGSPCQDLSGLNTSRQGLSGSRSGLTHHVPRIIHLISEVAQLPIHWMVENVASLPHSPW